MSGFERTVDAVRFERVDVLVLYGYYFFSWDEKKINQHIDFFYCTELIGAALEGNPNLKVIILTALDPDSSADSGFYAELEDAGLAALHLEERDDKRLQLVYTLGPSDQRNPYEMFVEGIRTAVSETPTESVSAASSGGQDEGVVERSARAGREPARHHAERDIEVHAGRLTGVGDFASRRRAHAAHSASRGGGGTAAVPAATPQAPNTASGMSL